jgi:hypothetical protein
LAIALSMLNELRALNHRFDVAWVAN